MKVSARSGAGNSFRRWIGVAGAALGLATGLAAGPTLAQGDPWPSRRPRTDHCARTRRIEYHSIKAFDFITCQRFAKKIALRRLKRKRGL